MSNSLKFKSPEIDIDKDNPWADDKLNRKKLADALTNFIVGLPDSMVFSLNGGWGSGKSFMLKRWQMDLRLNGFSAIYFNAWEDDYYNDPLIAIIGQLKEYMGHEWDSVAKYAMPFIKAGANIAFKAMTGGCADINGMEMSKNVFDEYNEARVNIQQLKQGIISAIQKTASNGKKLPLVFIIDELDRCRPTFAIELLERIKHIFDIPDIVFVLGIDREQLGHSIKCVYGQDMDVEGYLHRFIDMNFRLPDVDPAVFCDHLFRHWGIEDYFCCKADKNKNWTTDLKRFKLIFNKMCLGSRFSLREIEHAIRMFALAGRNIQDKASMLSDLLAVLIFLKMKNRKLYQEFSRGQCSAFKVLNFIFEMLQGDMSQDREFNLLEVQVYLTDDKNYDDDKNNIVLQQLELLTKGETINEPLRLSKRTMQLNKEQLEELVSFFRSIRDARKYNQILIWRESVCFLAEKIDLVSSLLEETL